MTRGDGFNALCSRRTQSEECLCVCACARNFEPDDKFVDAFECSRVRCARMESHANLSNVREFVVWTELTGRQRRQKRK